MERVIIIKLTTIPATGSKPTRLRITNLMTGKYVIVSRSYYYANGVDQADFLLRAHNLTLCADSFDTKGAHYFAVLGDTDKAIEGIKANKC